MHGTRNTTGSEDCLLLYSGVGNTLIFPMTLFLCLTCQIRSPVWRCVHLAGFRWSLPRRAGWCLWVLNTLAPTQLPPFWRVHLRRRLPWCVRKHTKSVQRWYLCAGRRNARTALLLRTAGWAAAEERGASMTPVARNVVRASPKHTAVMTGESDPVRSARAVRAASCRISAVSAEAALSAHTISTRASVESAMAARSASTTSEGHCARHAVALESASIPDKKVIARFARTSCVKSRGVRSETTHAEAARRQPARSDQE